MKVEELEYAQDPRNELCACMFRWLLAIRCVCSVCLLVRVYVDVCNTILDDTPEILNRTYMNGALCSMRHEEQYVDYCRNSYILYKYKRQRLIQPVVSRLRNTIYIRFHGHNETKENRIRRSILKFICI